MCQNSSVHLLSLTHTRVLPLLIRESQLTETLRWACLLDQARGRKENAATLDKTFVTVRCLPEQMKRAI